MLQIEQQQQKNPINLYEIPHQYATHTTTNQPNKNAQQNRLHLLLL